VEQVANLPRVVEQVANLLKGTAGWQPAPRNE
jgi:hypothetical protein